ncbi:MAG: hypothetical protein WD048_09020 [Chitinophagales bacterium]
MGLSIHYSGKFKKGASLPQMIEEVEDIAKIYKWKYFVFDTDFPAQSLDKETYNQRIYGINFTPPECETVSLTFLSNGRMSSLPHLKFFGKTAAQTEQEYLYMLSVKTQYAGIETHKIIIHLLKYLNKKYFSEFKVTDEGQYWETGDEERLKEVFARYNKLIDQFASSVENFPIKKGESFMEYFERLLDQIRKEK